MSDVFEYDEFRKVFKVGTKQIPVKVYRSQDNPASTVPFTRQALIAFENKWQLSVIWGNLTYSDNYDATVETFTDTPRTVEVAVFTPDGSLYPNGDPFYRVDVDEFLNLFDDISVKASNVNV